MDLFRKKQVNSNQHAANGLQRCLGVWDLTLLGVGAIIGAGIFVLTGISAATQAGPAIMLSYLLAGTACLFAALCYAELAASIGGCGSAYGYAYAGMGEIIAWIIGWDLLLEYGVACAAVAIGWSGYAHNILTAIGINMPAYLLKGPFEGGIINLPAVLIITCIMALLILGVRESVRFNALMVFIKLAVITVFISVAAFNVHPENWQPFMPFGWEGVVGGAAMIFFAYIGFDAVSTAADEAINPQRDLPIGILLSLAVCTIIYMLVSGLLTSIVPYNLLNVSSPVAAALLHIKYNAIAGIVAAGAIAGLTTVILVMFYGFTRIMLGMSTDGLLPSLFSRVNPNTKTPIYAILISGIIMLLIAGFVPIAEVVGVVNIGTLAAFTVVCIGVVLLRYSHPDLTRPFKVLFSPWIPLLGVSVCLYLMFHLSAFTWKVFFLWSMLGLFIYFRYGIFKSKLAVPIKKAY